VSDVQQSKEAVRLESVSVAAKDFYSAGATFLALGCAAIVVFVWGALASLYPPCHSKLCALFISSLIVWAYALVIPEPKSYPNAGKLRITLSEFLFGFINIFIVYSTALALEKL
jgi:hypothetical protein